jgi:hypothetical protein
MQMLIGLSESGQLALDGCSQIRLTGDALRSQRHGSSDHCSRNKKTQKH